MYMYQIVILIRIKLSRYGFFTMSTFLYINKKLLWTKPHISENGHNM